MSLHRMGLSGDNPRHQRDYLCSRHSSFRGETRIPALRSLLGVFQKIEKLAQVDFVEPTPPAKLYQVVAALKESIEDVGFDVTVRITLSNRPAARWTVSFEVLWVTCGSCVSTVDGALRTVEWPSVKMCGVFVGRVGPVRFL